MNDFEKVLNLIKENEKITLFRHQRPDGDATFSQMAIYQFINDNFKDKQVRICGFDTYDLFERIDETEDSFIEDSLAIVLDTANAERVDDNRFVDAKCVVKIDHHPPKTNYGDINIVDEKRSACCELLGYLFFSEENLIVSSITAEYLYSGLLTDTLNFKTTNTTYQTLEIASKLAKIGNFNISDITEYLFNDSLALFEAKTKLRNRLTISNSFGYCVLEESDCKDIGMSKDEAKNSIALFGNIKELNIWAIFVKNPETGSYDGSLRSKRGYYVNSVASNYNGGGHDNAAGVKGLSEETLQKIIRELSDYSADKNYLLND